MAINSTETKRVLPIYDKTLFIIYCLKNNICRDILFLIRKGDGIIYDTISKWFFDDCIVVTEYISVSHNCVVYTEKEDAFCHQTKSYFLEDDFMTYVIYEDIPEEHRDIMINAHILGACIRIDSLRMTADF